MSTNGSSPGTSVGHTLAGGVQDVSAILPLIGTEQCEKHVGSSLTGGYLYAAAAPLSIFGSLGIVKAGITILISSISVSIPHVSFSFHSFKPSIKYSSGQRKRFGGRMLKDAGFELTGFVASLIGMNGQCFKAETRLIEMLQDKHIDDPAKITLDWKIRQWNIMLVISTFSCALLSFTPYVALLLGPASWRPNSIHLPWLFPALRIIGSCIAAVACQFIIQSRVKSLMKNRLLFMIINQRLDATYKEGLNAWLKDPGSKWDASLAAEQCIWSLEQYLSSHDPSTNITEGEDPSNAQKQNATPQEAAPLPTGNSDYSHHISISSTPFPLENHPFGLDDLHRLQHTHFPTPTLDAAFTFLAWISLGLSLPAVVAGYIGCFTLVSATPTPGNGPLVWVAMEAALSIFRIFIWASNPSFDEDTEINLMLTLSVQQPILTTEDFNPYIFDLKHDERKPIVLVPEREFLEQITPFTGPLDQFPKDNNVTLYFTLTPEYKINHRRDQSLESESNYMSLFLTVLDFNMQIGVTLTFSEGSFYYCDSAITFNTIKRRFEANILSEKREAHPWRIEDKNLFDSLKQHYQYLLGALHQQDNKTSASLLWKWDLSQKSRPSHLHDNMPENPMPLSPLSLHVSPYFNPRTPSPLLAYHNQLYLKLGQEHRLKTDLIMTWGNWIVFDMAKIRFDGALNCHKALSQPKSQEAKWELFELDMQLALGWARRELVLLRKSLELEDTLCVSMETWAADIEHIRTGRIMSDFESGKRQRMEVERIAAKERMMKAMKEAANGERRYREEDSTFRPHDQWTTTIEFIDNQWSARINDQQPEQESTADSEQLEEDLKRAIDRVKLDRQRSNREKDVPEQNARHQQRDNFVAQLNVRISHEHWRPQHKVEEEMMQAAVDRIRTLPIARTTDELEMAYKRYPSPDKWATAKFVPLCDSLLKGKASLAMVYDAKNCDEETVCHVIAKSTTRSVVRVDPKIVGSIPPNDHLLFLSCQHMEVGEPDFVQRNRNKWWDQQTSNSSTFYFTPLDVWPDGNFCVAISETVACILLFLTTSSSVEIGVLHYGDFVTTSIETQRVTIRENGMDLSSISDIPEDPQLQSFSPFILQPGRYTLELVPCGGIYFLRDIFVNLSAAPPSLLLLP